MMDTAHQILAERRRHLQEGYGLSHDNVHMNGELLQAALAYMCFPGDGIWPWEPESYKPSTDPVRNLVKAGSLLAAEGDRLLRRKVSGLPISGGMIILGQDPEEIIATIDGLRSVRSQLEGL